MTAQVEALQVSLEIDLHYCLLHEVIVEQAKDYLRDKAMLQGRAIDEGTWTVGRHTVRGELYPE